MEDPGCPWDFNVPTDPPRVLLNLTQEAWEGLSICILTSSLAGRMPVHRPRVPHGEMEEIQYNLNYGACDMQPVCFLAEWGFLALLPVRKDRTAQPDPGQPSGGC